MKKVFDKLIRMLGFDAIGFERASGEIFQVEGHDDVRATPDSCCKNMVIILVGQAQSDDQIFIAINTCIRNGEVHQLGCPVQLLNAQVRPVF